MSYLIFSKEKNELTQELIKQKEAENQANIIRFTGMKDEQIKSITQTWQTKTNELLDEVILSYGALAGIFFILKFN